MNEQSAAPVSTEAAATLVVSLLKSWPSPNAPLLLQIAFCQEMRRAIQPFTTDGLHAKWFRRIDDQLRDTVVTLQKLVAAAEKEAKHVRAQLTKLTRQAPPELRAVIRQAQK